MVWIISLEITVSKIYFIHINFLLPLLIANIDKIKPPYETKQPSTSDLYSSQFKPSRDQDKLIQSTSLFFSNSITVQSKFDINDHNKLR